MQVVDLTGTVCDSGFTLMWRFDMGSYSFSQVPTADIPRSSFNRSHTHKTTFDGGYLVPFYTDEALPGDTFNVSASLFARLSTPIVPIMDNLWMDVFYFFVPLRLVWSNFQKMMGEQVNPGDSIDFLVPVLTDSSQIALGSCYDYFGCPIGVANLSISALFGRSYNLIWNQWFRDENLQNSLTVSLADASDAATAFPLQRRGKRHDYFTSALPWPQKGAGVMLPLGTSVPVVPNSPTAYPTFKGANASAGRMQPTSALTLSPMQIQRGTGGNWVANENLLWDSPNLVADLSSATAATINSLRQAFQIQKLLERDARGGTRYVEILKSHFGVTSPDARLQRPEFLGGGSFPVVINPVTQTSGTGLTGQTSPQGHLAGVGVVAGNRVGFTKSFVEHGIILGLVSVRADLTYQQGLPRMFSRRTRYDFYWPSFAHLGEQTILNKEIYASGVPATDDAVFGYQERWAEYRYFPSKITGKFRSNAAGTLDYWHLSQSFGALPVLNSSFIVDNPPISRVVAVTTEPQFIFDSHVAIKAARPMPTYSVPGLIDHF